jgi:hypothetical protein
MEVLFRLGLRAQQTRLVAIAFEASATKKSLNQIIGDKLAV